ncbi:hypothetical protein L210DRAFT_3505364 [Boletus edulis BED1]|uniref:Uncharacterized protein n=1 Tax=Boletus edulis BED1 TaxID=1328754 RepID=A0AAD4GE04_BOLED|nr:hypothetical protein L210DRAFT_3505364 [Boletus edulis BED1]
MFSVEYLASIPMYMMATYSNSDIPSGLAHDLGDDDPFRNGSEIFVNRLCHGVYSCQGCVLFVGVIMVGIRAPLWCHGKGNRGVSGSRGTLHLDRSGGVVNDEAPVWVTNPCCVYCPRSQKSRGGDDNAIVRLEHAQEGEGDGKAGEAHVRRNMMGWLFRDEQGSECGGSGSGIRMERYRKAEDGFDSSTDAEHACLANGDGVKKWRRAMPMVQRHIWMFKPRCLEEAAITAIHSWIISNRKRVVIGVAANDPASKRNDRTKLDIRTEELQPRFLRCLRTHPTARKLYNSGTRHISQVTMRGNRLQQKSTYIETPDERQGRSHGKSASYMAWYGPSLLFALVRPGVTCLITTKLVTVHSMIVVRLCRSNPNITG